MKFKELLRFLVAPEAPWRLGSHTTYASIPFLRKSLSIPLYELTTRQRSRIATFYASHPRSATFLVLRVLRECVVRNSNHEDAITRAAMDAYLVGVRLFGKDGQAALCRAFEIYSEQNETDAASISLQVEIVVNAGLNDSAVIQKLGDYKEALASGVALGEVDPDILLRGTDYAAYIGKHWMMCGAVFDEYYDAWNMKTAYLEEVEMLMTGNKR